MADNIDKEHLDNPTNNQSENPHDEIIPTNDTEAINQNQETENMEVHHHAHHEGKKNWKSYFWEFIMLFLAVFCGFLAEYQLEHVIEHQREKELMKSMIEDLSADTISLKQTIFYYEKLMPQTDSLIVFLKTKKCNENKIELYGLTYNLIYRFNGFIYNNRTIQQLKNAGNFRLIRNKLVSNKILEYDNLNVTAVQGTGQGLIDAFKNFETASSDIINLSEYQASAQVFIDSSYIPKLRISADPEIYTTEKGKINLLKTSVFNLWITSGFYKNVLHLTNQKTRELIGTINREYSLIE